GADDEELLLRAVMPAGEVDAMLAAGPARRHYNPDLAAVLGLLAGLGSRPGLTHLAGSKPGFRLELRRAGAGGGPGRRRYGAGGPARAAAHHPRVRLRPRRHAGADRPAE